MVWFMVLNSAFNNISAVSWQSLLLVDGTRVPGENHRPVEYFKVTTFSILFFFQYLLYFHPKFFQTGKRNKAM
jgi:hypothetical protein